MLSDDQFRRILEAIDRVEDPEVPVTLRDLGVLRSATKVGSQIHVVLRATKIGCPGKTRMVDDIVAACATVSPGSNVEVQWDLTPWTSDDVTEHGRVALREFGIVVDQAADVTCPYCSSAVVENLAEYGGSICKVPFRCGSCGSIFDRLRSVEGVQIVTIGKKAR
jgi:ring-1,2-phenylacetyl-CoA epoxidase subunit PaaD